jgi:hypothetical protein
VLHCTATRLQERGLSSHLVNLGWSDYGFGSIVSMIILVHTQIIHAFRVSHTDII